MMYIYWYFSKDVSQYDKHIATIDGANELQALSTPHVVVLRLSAYDHSLQLGAKRSLVLICISYETTISTAAYSTLFHIIFHLSLQTDTVVDLCMQISDISNL